MQVNAHAGEYVWLTTMEVCTPQQLYPNSLENIATEQ